MTELHAPTARAVQYNGVHGNTSTAALSMILAAAAPGDTVILGEFDAQPTITDFRVDHEALGTGVSLDLGFAYLDGDMPDEPQALAAGLSAASGGQKRMAQAPVKAGAKFCQLIATVKGGTANGKFDVTATYVNQG